MKSSLKKYNELYIVASRWAIIDSVFLVALHFVIYGLPHAFFNLLALNNPILGLYSSGVLRGVVWCLFVEVSSWTA